MSIQGLARPCALKELFVDGYPWRGNKQRWVIMRWFNPFRAWVDSEKQLWAFSLLGSLLVMWENSMSNLWSWWMCVHLSIGVHANAWRWSAAPCHWIPDCGTETRGCCTCHESKIMTLMLQNQVILVLNSRTYICSRNIMLNQIILKYYWWFSAHAFYLSSRLVCIISHIISCTYQKSVINH